MPPKFRLFLLPNLDQCYCGIVFIRYRSNSLQFCQRQRFTFRSHFSFELANGGSVSESKAGIRKITRRLTNKPNLDLMEKRRGGELAAGRTVVDWLMLKKQLGVLIHQTSGKQNEK